MKLAVTLFDVNNVNRLLDLGADIIIAGHGEFANRLVHSFTEEELTEISTMVHKQGKELYVPVNRIVHNDHLEAIGAHLDFLKTIAVDGIFFGDVGLYQLAKEREMVSILIYNPETLNTNSFDPIFWSSLGIKGITVAKEIPLHDILDICKQSPISVSMTGHGHLNMFHSRRPLIENFFKYKDEEHEEYVNNRKLRLVEEVRNESYPIFQDDHGTHIFRERPMQAFKEILQLENHLDVFIIDAILQDEVYLESVLSHYVDILATKNIDLAQTVTQQYESTHDSGFLYKKTVYVKN